MKIPLLLLILAVFSFQGWDNPALSDDKARRFDFWIGQWDVNLRIRQDDLSWKNSVRADARIFPVADGHAILELWQSDPILGYSLRYYDRALDKWVLWLNWPGRNRSGSSSLQGSFRHGRGEFFSTSTAADGTETISRYSFADISPVSLRWDDAYSTDGGDSWRANWIMEFSRRSDRPSLGSEETAHTFAGGNRCDLAEFRSYEFLAGQRTGTDAEGRLATARGYRVLGGCAVITLFEGGSVKRFGHLTYNTYRGAYELTSIDNTGAGARLYYGSLTEEVFVLDHRPDAASEPTERYRLRFDDTTGALTEEWLRREGSGWAASSTLTLSPTR